jgi:hypothetical protein
VLPVPLVPLACLPSFAVDRLWARRPLVAVVLNALVLTAIIHAAGALRNALAPGDADDLRWAVAAWSAAALATLGGYAWALLGRWIVRGVRLDWSRVGSTVPLFPEAAMAATAVLGATLWRVDPWLVLYLVGPLVILQRLLRFREVLVAPRTDGKTRPANYRFFEDCARRELGRSRRTGAPLALLVVDIDGLRDVNNTYGHPVGDRALLHVADVLRRAAVRRGLPVRGRGVPRAAAGDAAGRRRRCRRTPACGRGGGAAASGRPAGARQRLHRGRCPGPGGAGHGRAGAPPHGRRRPGLRRQNAGRDPVVAGPLPV